MFSRKSAQDYVDKAQEVLEAGDIGEALLNLGKGLKKDPAHSQAWFIQGTILQEIGQLEHAIGCYQNSFKSAPPERAHLPLFNLGVALQEAGQMDAALDAYDGVIKMNPEDSDAWINKGRLLDDANQFKEALKCYKQALAISPKDADAWANSGNSFTNLRRFDDALKCYGKALKFDPNHDKATIARQKCLEFKKRYSEN